MASVGQRLRPSLHFGLFLKLLCSLPLWALAHNLQSARNILPSALDLTCCSYHLGPRLNSAPQPALWISGSKGSTLTSPSASTALPSSSRVLFVAQDPHNRNYPCLYLFGLSPITRMKPTGKPCPWILHFLWHSQQLEQWLACAKHL